jgi:Fic family protein
VDWRGKAQAMHPIGREAECHARFEKIHPFVDGNGRTGRLLLNLELMKEGYPAAVIRKEDRLAYYAALDEAGVAGDYAGITALVAAAVKRSIDLYLETLDLNTR